METVEDFPEGRWEFEEVMEGREEGIGGEGEVPFGLSGGARSRG